MSEEEVEWSHAGISKIKEDSGDKYVRVPDRVFRDENILELDHTVTWYYNEYSQTLIVSQSRLDKEDYRNTGRSTKFRKGDSKYGLVIPKPFYDNDSGVRGTGVQPEKMRDVILPEEGFLHFLYHNGMAEGTKKSCYVLTEDQFNKRFSDSDAWDGTLEQTPKFF
jgi:hypothetical protein